MYRELSGTECGLFFFTNAKTKSTGVDCKCVILGQECDFKGSGIENNVYEFYRPEDPTSEPINDPTEDPTSEPVEDQGTGQGKIQDFPG